MSGEDSILEYLRLANFGLDADVIIAVDTMLSRQDAQHQVTEIVNSTDINIAKSTIKNNVDSEIYTFTPFIGNMSNISTFDFCGDNGPNATNALCMLQIYKIRKSCNTSLVIHDLGFWTFENGTKYMRPFTNTEERKNFFQFALIFGEKNSSESLASENVETEDDGDDSDLQEFVKYFCSLLNTSKLTLSYPKLGSKNSDGEWTDLFGAIIKEDVDIAVDSIVRTPERSADMAFTHPIMKSRRNIYIQPQESNELRDIFLVPFDLRLIQCVIGTGVTLAVVMTIFKHVIKRFQVAPGVKDCCFLDSAMWSIGIFGQQGSIWKPSSSAEQIIIIVSLAFTLVIYNSYSAFITSVLSVKLSDIRTVSDLLNSDYEIGYVKNSADENYLRSMNITQLNEIYLRGYLHNNIANITEGLLKAAKGNYGFFTSGHVARKQLLVISNYKCKYDIAEIPIKDTENYIAFPMSKHSSYKKLINLSMIKMYESGVYKRIYPFLYPNLQTCEKPTTYQSARLPDLTTAFGILVFGIIFSVIVITGECIWKKKKRIYSLIRKKVQQKSTDKNKQFPKHQHLVFMK